MKVALHCQPSVLKVFNAFHASPVKYNPAFDMSCEQKPKTQVVIRS